MLLESSMQIWLKSRCNIMLNFNSTVTVIFHNKWIVIIHVYMKYVLRWWCTFGLRSFTRMLNGALLNFIWISCLYFKKHQWYGHFIWIGFRIRTAWMDRCDSINYDLCWWTVILVLISRENRKKAIMDFDRIVWDALASVYDAWMLRRYTE